MVDMNKIDVEKLLIVDGKYPMPLPVLDEYPDIFVKTSSHTTPPLPSVVKRYSDVIGRFVFESMAKRLRRISKSVSNERPFGEKGSILS
jgi:hypothetical protein